MTLGAFGIADGDALGVNISSDELAPGTVVTQVVLPSSLVPAHGVSLQIATSDGTSVAAVKVAIEAATGLTIGAQELVYNGAALSDDGRTLSAQGVPSGATLVLTLTVPSAASLTATVAVGLPGAMGVLFGGAVRVRVSSAETVGSLKAKVAAITSVSAVNLTLVDGSTVLEPDGVTLGAFGIADGDALDVISGGQLQLPAFTLTIKLPASLHSTHGEALVVASDTGRTLMELHSLIERLTGVNATHQRLMIREVELGPRESTLSSAGLLSGDVLVLMSPLDVEALGGAFVDWQMSVPAPLRQRYGREVDMSATVRWSATQLAYLASYHLDVPVQRIGIDIDGATIAGDTTIADALNWTKDPNWSYGATLGVRLSDVVLPHPLTTLVVVAAASLVFCTLLVPFGLVCIRRHRHQTVAVLLTFTFTVTALALLVHFAPTRSLIPRSFFGRLIRALQRHGGLTAHFPPAHVALRLPSVPASESAAAAANNGQRRLQSAASDAPEEAAEQSATAFMPKELAAIVNLLLVASLAIVVTVSISHPADVVHRVRVHNITWWRHPAPFARCRCSWKGC